MLLCDNGKTTFVVLHAIIMVDRANVISCQQNKTHSSGAVLCYLVLHLRFQIYP